MLKLRANSFHTRPAAGIAIVLFCLLLGNPHWLMAGGKKKKDVAPAAAPAEAPKPQVDVSKLVWPEPPNIPRVRYVSYFAGAKLDTTPAAQQPKQKQSWMDRLAGVQDVNAKKYKPVPFQLMGPMGMAVDSKGQLYVVDQKVGAIFIFNTETKDVGLIRHGFEASFGLINGIAIDDDDRLFVTDGKLRRVLVFDKKHEVVDQIREGFVDPVGIAVDSENRLLYVVDTQQDQVLVFDADSLKPLRRIGTGGKKHELTTPGDFSAPTGVAVDGDGNVYVTDTLNNRVEIFDADGKFISQFGRHCDGPGCFAHAKGIAVDSDGHVWVADPMLDLLQIFTRDGQLAGIIGGHGQTLGQFSSLVNVAFDKKSNRAFTSEQYPGRVQMFRYVTDAEADQLKKEKEAQRGGSVASNSQEAPTSVATAQPKTDSTEVKK